MQITDQGQLQVGKKFYHVSALGKYSHMSTLIIKESPFELQLESRKYLLVSVTVVMPDGGDFVHDESLQDMNVIPNTYNLHKLFDNEEEAIKYRDEMKVLDHPLNKVRNYEWGEHDMYDFDRDDWDPALEPFNDKAIE